MRLKGPVFPSYLNQKPEAKGKMQWKAHCNTRAAMRNLRHKCHRFLVSRDTEIVAQVDRVRNAVKDEPNPEFGLLHLLCAAVDASEGTGVAWAECMKYYMDQFDAQATV